VSLRDAFWPVPKATILSLSAFVERSDLLTLKTPANVQTAWPTSVERTQLSRELRLVDQAILSDSELAERLSHWDLHPEKTVHFLLI